MPRRSKKTRDHRNLLPSQKATKANDITDSWANKLLKDLKKRA